MYAKLLEFVPHHCRLLREVTGGAVSRYACCLHWFATFCCIIFLCTLTYITPFCVLSDKADIVPGYDFLVNSVWPEIIRGIEERLPSIFSPGNPDVFYEVNTGKNVFMLKPRHFRNIQVYTCLCVYICFKMPFLDGSLCLLVFRDILSAWILCVSLRDSVVLRPVWRDCVHMLPTRASTTNGTCQCTSSCGMMTFFGQKHIDMLFKCFCP